MNKRNIVLPLTLNRRAAYNFAERMSHIENNEYYFSRPGSTVTINAKSVLGLLSAGFVKGEDIVVSVLTENENDAFSSLWNVFEEMKEDENFN